MLSNRMDAVAMDALCIVGVNGERYCTEIYVKFYRTTGVARTFLSAERRNLENDTTIDMYCNDRLCSLPIVTTLGNDRCVKFDLLNETHTYPSSIPTPEILKRLPLIAGANRLRFVHRETMTVVECNLWLWSYTDRIMVVDIDGTITRSDVRGYIETVYMQTYRYCHRGVVAFFHGLAVELNLKILFLTSRPIAHLQETRNLLNSLRKPKDNDFSAETLPDGPIFANKDNVAKAAYRELILRGSEEYKTDVLWNIVRVYQRARTWDEAAGTSVFSFGNRSFAMENTPFVLGFGNKSSDAKAYCSVGIPSHRIFVIDRSSTVRLWKHCLLLEQQKRNQDMVAEEEDDCSIQEAQHRMQTASSYPHARAMHLSTKEDAAASCTQTRNEEPPPLFDTNNESVMEFESYADTKLFGYIVEELRTPTLGGESDQPRSNRRMLSRDVSAQLSPANRRALLSKAMSVPASVTLGSGGSASSRTSPIPIPMARWTETRDTSPTRSFPKTPHGERGMGTACLQAFCAPGVVAAFTADPLPSPPSSSTT